MIIDLTFATGYGVDLLDELPGTPDPVQFYFPPTGSGGQDGLLLRIKSDGTSWVGCFAFDAVGLSACIASPQPGRLFVVSRGAGYVIDVTRPGEWTQVGCVPVREVRVLADQNMVLLADFTRIVAHGVNGLMWRSDRLCWDDLKILSVEGGRIIGSGYDPTNSTNPEGRFELDLSTGKVIRTQFTTIG